MSKNDNYQRIYELLESNFLETILKISLASSFCISSNTTAKTTNTSPKKYIHSFNLVYF